MTTYKKDIFQVTYMKNVKRFLFKKKHEGNDFTTTNDNISF